jgi:hypothetical protein
MSLSVSPTTALVRRLELVTRPPAALIVSGEATLASLASAAWAARTLDRSGYGVWFRLARSAFSRAGMRGVLDLAAWFRGDAPVSPPALEEIVFPLAPFTPTAVHLLPCERRRVTAISGLWWHPEKLLVSPDADRPLGRDPRARLRLGVRLGMSLRPARPLPAIPSGIELHAVRAGPLLITPYDSGLAAVSPADRFSLGGFVRVVHEP